MRDDGAPAVPPRLASDPVAPPIPYRATAPLPRDASAPAVQPRPGRAPTPRPCNHAPAVPRRPGRAIAPRPYRISSGVHSRRSRRLRAAAEAKSGTGSGVVIIVVKVCTGTVAATSAARDRSFPDAAADGRDAAVGGGRPLPPKPAIMDAGTDCGSAVRGRFCGCCTSSWPSVGAARAGA